MRVTNWVLVAAAVGAAATLVLYGGPTCPSGQDCEWPAVGLLSLAVILLALGILVVRLMRSPKS